MAKFKVGDKVVWTAFGGKPMEVIDMNDKGEYLCRDKDGNEVVFSEEKLKLANACNASSSPFGFFVGEQVVIKKDPSNKKYRVKEITETGDIRLEGATPLFDASELDTANYAGPYRACNSKNAIVRKAMNAEDAQGHEHGADGKFASKDGGSSDGGYEDPKTKRMKERLAKMREKNEALRKDIEARKAGLAQKRADTEKMRAEVMKANVEKWKAGLPKTKNTIVEKAINAVAKNYKPTSEFEVGDTVRFKDSVRSVPHDETYKVVKVYPLVGRIIIKSNDGKTSDEFVNDLEIV